MVAVFRCFGINSLPTSMWFSVWMSNGWSAQGVRYCQSGSIQLMSLQSGSGWLWNRKQGDSSRSAWLPPTSKSTSMVHSLHQIAQRCECESGCVKWQFGSLSRVTPAIRPLTAGISSTTKHKWAENVKHIGESVVSVVNLGGFDNKVDGDIGADSSGWIPAAWEDTSTSGRIPYRFHMCHLHISSYNVSPVRFYSICPLPCQGGQGNLFLALFGAIYSSP